MHLLVAVLDDEDLLLHEPEGELGAEDLLVLLEETSGDPLVDRHPDHLSQGEDSGLLVLELLRLLDGLEEEGGEGLEGILIHMINDGERNKHEVKHSTLGCDTSVHFSQCVDVRLSHFCKLLLLFDLSRSLLSLFQLVDQLRVLKDRCRISI